MPRSLLLAALVAAPLGVHAAPDDTGESGRTLNGHPFLPMAAVQQPFVNTEFQSVTGIGLASTTLDDETLASLRSSFGIDARREQPLGVLRTAIGVQAGFADLVAVRGAIAGNIITGRNNESALLLGATAAPQFTLGAAVRVVRLQTLDLAIGADIDRSTGYVLSPLTLLSSLLENKRTIFARQDTFSFAPSVRLAFAPHRVVGLVGSFGPSVNQVKIENLPVETTSDWRLALGTSLNLQPVGVPVGATLGWARVFAGEPAEESSGVEVGLYPVSLSHFNLGIGGWFESFGIDSSAQYFQVLLQYSR